MPGHSQSVTTVCYTLHRIPLCKYELYPNTLNVATHTFEF